MKKKEIVSDDEIDLIELAQALWAKRYFVLKVTSIFMLLGLLIAFTSKVEYEATCKLMPESQDESIPNLGGLGGLAGLAGIDLDLSGYGALTPELYPEIVQSVPFLQKLITAPIYFEKLDSTISSFEYFRELDNPSIFGFIMEYTVGLPGKIKKSFESSGLTQSENYGMIRFSKEEWKLIENYSERLSVSVDSKTGIISIATEMPDAVAAAKVASILVEELTKNVSDYKLEKVKINLEFIQERFTEAKSQYAQKQKQLALFTDRNRNISNSLIQTEYERLQNEMNIAFEVYKGLATKLEQAKIKVKEETPVFTVLDPVRVPVDKSRPRRMIIIIFSVFIGLIVSVSYLMVSMLFKGSGD